MLREHVLTKWIAVLDEWLEMIDESQENDDREQTIQEIVQWYSGWKKFIPQSILEVNLVEDVFKLALMVIYSKLD